MGNASSNRNAGSTLVPFNIGTLLMLTDIEVVDIKVKKDIYGLPLPKVFMWTPHFGSMRFPLDGELEFLFEKLIFFIVEENDLESPLIFVLFLKG